MLGFVPRSIAGMLPMVFRQLYTALVLSVMEYCSAIWLPHCTALHARLASVQCHAAYALYSQSMPKSQRLSYTQTKTTTLLQFASWQPLISRTQAATFRLLCSLLGAGHQTLVGAVRLMQHASCTTPSTFSPFRPERKDTVPHGSPVPLRCGNSFQWTSPEHSPPNPENPDIGPISKAAQHLR